jgi:hypothetical protein
MSKIDEINPDNIRIWAYDKSLYFLEQDEDLMLHKPEFVPTLMELASKDDCPKQESIKSILEYYIQWCFLYQKNNQIEEINIIILDSKSLLATQWLIMWALNFQYIFGIYTKPRRITEAACDKIAKDLTVGEYCKRDFKKLGQLNDGAYEYEAKTTSFTLHFYINPETGQWKISRYGRLLNFD